MHPRFQHAARLPISTHPQTTSETLPAADQNRCARVTTRTRKHGLRTPLNKIRLLWEITGHVALHTEPTTPSEDPTLTRQQRRKTRGTKTQRQTNYAECETSHRRLRRTTRRVITKQPPLHVAPMSATARLPKTKRRHDDSYKRPFAR
ncbi:MAG: hypothetical protein [Microviridae sp.]|nr:MAG: hypothetical protein [Microviridae sp.]